MKLENCSIEKLGFKIGHSTDVDNATGCTVIIALEGANAAVDVRGGGPATRETDLLRCENTIQKIHACVLSGGSAFGLEASCGVARRLGEQNIGFDLRGIIIPIVVGASLFDCSVGNPKAFPDIKMGMEAVDNAQHFDATMGNIGAGTGASVGKFFGFDKAMKTGLGHHAFQLNELIVGAIVAVNACGDVYLPNSQIKLAGARTNQSLYELLSPPARTNTTIGAILTNANLDKAQLTKLAQMSQDAYAHCIRPVHTPNDGDTIFSMTTGKVEVELDLVALLAVEAMEQAIVNAVQYAQAAYGIPSCHEHHFSRKG